VSTAVELDAASVASGADLAGKVVVTNTGSAAVHVAGGAPLTADVLDGRGAEVAVYDGNIGGVGISRDLAPGAALDLDLHVGTASCDPRLGNALPPGTYQVVATVGTVDGQPLVAGPVGLVVTG
jgi:hypothetical protein